MAALFIFYLVVWLIRLTEEFELIGPGAFFIWGAVLTPTVLGLQENDERGLEFA